MKFVISKDKLNLLVQKALNVVPVRSTLPVLSNIFLEVGDNKVKMRATDLDVSITSEAEAEVSSSGKLTIPGRILADLIRELPNSDVTVTAVDKRIEIKSDRGVYKLSGISAAEFPRFPKVDFKKEKKINGGILKGMIRKAIFAVSRDETRPALNGTLWKSSEEKLILVATNGHILSKVEQRGIEIEELEDGIIVPPKALEFFMKLYGESSDEVGIIIGEENLVFRFGDTIITTRLIDGPYPNFEQVIPKEFSQKAIFEKADFSSMIRRVSILADNITHQVKLAFTTDMAKVSATNFDVGGEGQDELTVDYQGEEFEIGYNASYLIDIIKQVETDQAVMEFTGPTSAAVITPSSFKDNEDYLFLIMPLRLTE